MRQLTLSLCFLLFAVLLWAQTPSDSKKEKAAILRAKNVLVSSLDRGLPKVSLEFFLKYEAGGAPIDWDVIDCGGQSGNSVTGGGPEAPMCVMADFEKSQTSVSVVVSVATLQNGPAGIPTLIGVTVNGPNGRSLSLRQLSDLPKELHRPAPKSPRDLPNPTIASSG